MLFFCCCCAGTGLGQLADDLVDSMTLTFGKSSDKAEELRNRVGQLEMEVTTLSTNLDKTTKEKIHLAQKLRSEQLNLRQMCKRVGKRELKENVSSCPDIVLFPFCMTDLCDEPFWTHAFVVLFLFFFC